MANLPPILRCGSIYGNVILRGINTYVSDVDITQPFGIQVGFYSPSGEYIGSISSSPDSAGYIKFKLSVELNRGLRDFEFSIARNVDIPFYTGMEVRFYITGKLWYVGELIYQPNQDKRTPVYEYSGKGFWSHLKKNKISTTWQVKKLDFVIKDIIQNYVEPETRIIYNPALIVCPNILITEYEAKNKYPLKALEDLVDLANYDPDGIGEYHIGVNNERQFFFLPIESDVTYGLFEGFQFQEPDVKVEIKDIENYVEINRMKKNSKEVEYVSTIQDTQSQDQYGIQAIDNFVIASYIDATTVERIARARIQKNKDPKIKESIANLECLEEPFPFEYYYLNNRRNDYTKLISDCDILSDWSIHFNNTSITTTKIKVYSGLRSFQIDTQNGSKGEYLEFELETEINYPNQLRCYFSQSAVGKVLKFYVYDIDNKVQTFETDINLIVDFQTPIMNLNLDNIKKIRIEIVTNGNYTIYLDRIDCLQQAYNQHKLLLNEINYELDKNTLLASADFGDKLDNILDDIKKIKDGQNNLYNIFQRNI